MKKKNVTLIIVAVLVVAFGLYYAFASKSALGPKKKDVLVWGMLTDVETLNPILSEASAETIMMNGIFSTLMKVNDKLEFEPDLLVKLPEVSEDGLVYTFELRKGVKFHDGVELTAEDVEFLYEMKMAPGNIVPSRAMWEKIDKFEIIDDYNFKITLKELDVTWLEGWAYSECMIPPKHILEKEYAENGNSLTKGGEFSRNPIGSGPYKFIEWKANEYVKLERFDDYYREGSPKIKTIVYKVVPDTNSLLAQFKSGEIDVYDGAQANQYKELMAMKEAGQKIEVHKYPAYVYMHADFNLRNPIFADKRVRQALCYAFPKQQFIDTVLDGIGTWADSCVAPNCWAFKPELKRYDYDPDKAAQLLEEAGWKLGADGVRVKDGKKLAFSISTNSGNKIREKFNEIAKQEWDAVGCDVTIQNYEASTLFGDILENVKFDIAVFGWSAGFDPDCKTLYHTDQIVDPATGATGQNYVGYSNPHLDQLLDAGLKEPDQEKRKEIYYEIQDILAEDVPYIFVYYYNEIAAVPANLANFKPNPTQATNTWNMYEWEWK